MKTLAEWHKNAAAKGNATAKFLSICFEISMWPLCRYSYRVACNVLNFENSYSRFIFGTLGFILKMLVPKSKMPLPIIELCGCQCQAAWNFAGIQVLFKCCCLTVALALGHGDHADEGKPVQRREYHQETRQFDIQDEIFAYITKLLSSKRHIKIFEVIFSVLEKKYTHSICSRGE